MPLRLDLPRALLGCGVGAWFDGLPYRWIVRLGRTRCFVQAGKHGRIELGRVEDHIQRKRGDGTIAGFKSRLDVIDCPLPLFRSCVRDQPDECRRLVAGDRRLPKRRNTEPGLRRHPGQCERQQGCGLGWVDGSCCGLDGRKSGHRSRRVIEVATV